MEVLKFIFQSENSTVGFFFGVILLGIGLKQLYKFIIVMKHGYPKDDNNNDE